MSLHKKASSLGHLTGKSLSEIVEACGKPRKTVEKEFTDVGKGTQVTWKDTLFSFCLNFDGEGRCCGVYWIHDLSPYVALLALSVVIVGGIILMVRLF